MESSNIGKSTGGVLDPGSGEGFRFSCKLGSPAIRWHNGGNITPYVLIISNPLNPNESGQYGFLSNGQAGIMAIYVNGALQGSTSKGNDKRMANRLRLFINSDGNIDNSKLSELIIFNQPLDDYQRRVLMSGQCSYFDIKAN